MSQEGMEEGPRLLARRTTRTLELQNGQLLALDGETHSDAILAVMAMTTSASAKSTARLVTRDPLKSPAQASCGQPQQMATDHWPHDLSARVCVSITAPCQTTPLGLHIETCADQASMWIRGHLPRPRPHSGERGAEMTWQVKPQGC